MNSLTVFGGDFTMIFDRKFMIAYHEWMIRAHTGIGVLNVSCAAWYQNTSFLALGLVNVAFILYSSYKVKRKYNGTR